jgi:hypothetical protein
MMTVLTIFFPCSRFSWHSRVGSTTGRVRLRCAREWTILSMVVSVLAAWPTLVSADPITLDQDIRGVSVFLQTVGGVREQAADFLTVANSSSVVSGTATLISSISNLHHLTGSGVASLESVGNADLFAAASSLFVVGFTIDALHDYSFRGTWTGDKTSAAILKTNTGETFFDHVNGPGSFESSGRLPSGAYSLEVASAVTGSSFSPGTRLSSAFDFAFDLQASPTPEPASIFLLGSGLTALAVAIRRRSPRP